ncbi:hypothetical protein [Noviherbaspirillum aerium]|uniref:hypothetical protein n=1 Tax=Noviherbaspirillum aerium TaxID=2588497 RepID=UPI00124D7F2E|nr:hypothetical protein [Noviherbaspirillum aerium]
MPTILTNQGNHKKLLIAVRETDIQLTESFLEGGYQLVYCHTLDAAKMALEDGVDIVVAGVHFDGGAVFELLRYVRMNVAFGKLPFFVLLDTSERYNYSPAIIHGLKTAAKALGATALTDLGALVEKFGREEAIAILRRGILDTL